MPAGGDKIRLHQSWTYVATRNGLVLGALYLAAMVQAGAGPSVGPFLFYLFVWGAWTALGAATDTTTLIGGRIRGASSTRGIWSTRPPAISQVDAITTTTRGIGRIVMIEATDINGEVIHWRLDAPRSLRWGHDPQFEANLELLHNAWSDSTRRSVPT